MNYFIKKFFHELRKHQKNRDTLPFCFNITDLSRKDFRALYIVLKELKLNVDIFESNSKEFLNISNSEIFDPNFDESTVNWINKYNYFTNIIEKLHNQPNNVLRLDDYR